MDEEFHIELDELEKILLDLILEHGYMTIIAKMSVAMSEMRMNPKQYIDLVVKEKGFRDIPKLDRIIATRYLGLRKDLAEAKEFIEELYEDD